MQLITNLALVCYNYVVEQNLLEFLGKEKNNFSNILVIIL